VEVEDDEGVEQCLDELLLELQEIDELEEVVAEAGQAHEVVEQHLLEGQHPRVLHPPVLPSPGHAQVQQEHVSQSGRRPQHQLACYHATPRSPP
jgi:hypothetical protein